MTCSMTLRPITLQLPTPQSTWTLHIPHPPSSQSVLPILTNKLQQFRPSYSPFCIRAIRISATVGIPLSQNLRPHLRKSPQHPHHHLPHNMVQHSTSYQNNKAVIYLPPGCTPQAVRSLRESVAKSACWKRSSQTCSHQNHSLRVAPKSRATTRFWPTCFPISKVACQSSLPKQIKWHIEERLITWATCIMTLTT